MISNYSITPSENLGFEFMQLCRFHSCNHYIYSVFRFIRLSHGVIAMASLSWIRNINICLRMHGIHFDFVNVIGLESLIVYLHANVTKHWYMLSAITVIILRWAMVLKVNIFNNRVFRCYFSQFPFSMCETLQHNAWFVIIASLFTP